jgi:hypothetical protein
MALEQGTSEEAPPPPPTAALPVEAPRAAGAAALAGKQTSAVLAVREALARQPNPAALLFLDPGAPVPLTPLQASSVEGWRAGVPANYAPTTQLLRAHAKVELAAGREQARKELAGEVERARPDASDPKGLAEAWAAMGFAALRPARYRPGGAPPRPAQGAGGLGAHGRRGRAIRGARGVASVRGLRLTGRVLRRRHMQLGAGRGLAVGP